jgi:tRNA-splicing ligase RtcB
MAKGNYKVLKVDKGVPVKAWTKGVPLEKEAEQQLMNVAQMPFVHSHIAVMPDVHWGLGATIGSVIPTLKAIIPAAVGVDIGCGMMAVQTHTGGSRCGYRVRHDGGADQFESDRFAGKLEGHPLEY